MTHETHITIEPIPANPGYVADITGHLADPECDPRGFGMTRLAAALDLARSLVERGDEDGAHPATCLAIAAVLREDMAVCLAFPSVDAQDRAAMRFAYERAIALVEGVA